MTNSASKHRITVIWFVLVAATLISWELGHGVGIDDLRIASIVVLMVAFIKVRFVAFEFMELRHAPRFMRLAADGWLLATSGVLTTLYVLGT